MPLEHSTLRTTKRVRLVLEVRINQKLDNSNVPSVQSLLVESVSLLDQAHDQQPIVRSVVQLASSLIPKVVFAVRADTVSINHKRDLSVVISVDLARQHDWPRLRLVQNVATNALPVNNWDPMAGVKPVHVAHSDYREFNQPVLPVQSDELRPRLEPHRSKSAHFQCARQEHS